VAIEDEEVGSPTKGEKTLFFLEKLPTPIDMVKPSSSTQETPVIPSVAAPPPHPLENCVF
jgi:hypothetical protein